jgi:hypothetical protein
MSLEGTIHNGMVVFDQPIPLPEGTRVSVAPVHPVGASPVENSILDRLGDVVGAIDDLPADGAENLDHYLYGTPKRR